MVEPNLCVAHVARRKASTKFLRVRFYLVDTQLQDLGQRLTAGLAEWTKPTLLLTGDGDKYIKVLGHSVCHP